MATSYSGLKTEIADFYERNDLTSVVGTFVALCESEMQRELKLSYEETAGQIQIISGTGLIAGTGSLSSGYVSLRSVTWRGSPSRLLTYVPPTEFSRIHSASPTRAEYYTIEGDLIKTTSDESGYVDVIYQLSFLPLSDSTTSNNILFYHPAAYLYGSLVHAAVYCKDFEGAIAYRKLFDNEVQQIKADIFERKYAGPLAVRAA